MQEDNTNKEISILAHSGNFHADDVFAVATLELMFEKEGKRYNVLRSRDHAVIASADFVVDVGGIYDPSKNRFDHHQEEGGGVRGNGIPYASFGLVWKEYGEKLCGNVEVCNKIDEQLVQSIDATDNGMEIVEPKIENVRPFEIGLFFHMLMPTRNETDVKIDEVFKVAVSYAKVVLTRIIIWEKDKIEAREIVRDFYFKAEDKRVIYFDRFYPSSEFLSEFPEPLFTAYPREDGVWNLKGVREYPDAFINKKYFPKDWAGKVDGELETVTGVPGAIFCHKNRFIVAAKTREAIEHLAKLALDSKD